MLQLTGIMNKLFAINVPELQLDVMHIRQNLLHMLNLIDSNVAIQKDLHKTNKNWVLKLKELLDMIALYIKPDQSGLYVHIHTAKDLSNVCGELINQEIQLRELLIKSNKQFGSNKELLITNMLEDLLIRINKRNIEPSFEALADVYFNSAYTLSRKDLKEIMAISEDSLVDLEKKTSMLNTERNKIFTADQCITLIHELSVSVNANKQVNKNKSVKENKQQITQQNAKNTKTSKKSFKNSHNTLQAYDKELRETQGYNNGPRLFIQCLP